MWVLIAAGLLGSIMASSADVFEVGGLAGADSYTNGYGDSYDDGAGYVGNRRSKQQNRQRRPIFSTSRNSDRPSSGHSQSQVPWDNTGNSYQPEVLSEGYNRGTGSSRSHGYRTTSSRGNYNRNTYHRNTKSLSSNGNRRSNYHGNDYGNRKSGGTSHSHGRHGDGRNTNYRSSNSHDRNNYHGNDRTSNSYDRNNYHGNDYGSSAYRNRKTASGRGHSNRYGGNTKSYSSSSGRSYGNRNSGTNENYNNRNRNYDNNDKYNNANRNYGNNGNYNNGNNHNDNNGNNGYSNNDNYKNGQDAGQSRSGYHDNDQVTGGTGNIYDKLKDRESYNIDSADSMNFRK